jgi:hypothetical protein
MYGLWAHPTFSSPEEEDGGTREGRERGRAFILVGFKKPFKCTLTYKFRLKQCKTFFISPYPYGKLPTKDS